MNMRATRATSAGAGAGFGVLASLVEIARAAVAGTPVSIYMSLALLIGFFVSVLFGAIGIAQSRDFHAKRQGRGILMDIKKEEAAAFLVPLWGRMLVWFLAAGASALVVKAIWNIVS